MTLHYLIFYLNRAITFLYYLRIVPDKIISTALQLDCNIKLKKKEQIKFLLN